MVQELLLRHRARTVLVVCPAGLCVKWQEEMRERFGLEFRIVNTDAVRQLRRDRGVGRERVHVVPAPDRLDRLAEGPSCQSLLDEVLAGVDHRRTPRKFDLLIVDEVHSAAPSGRGRYAIDSLRTQAIQRLAPHFEHRLFLSATPHNGYNGELHRAAGAARPAALRADVDPNPEQLREVLVRRLKRELREELPPEPGRHRPVPGAAGRWRWRSTTPTTSARPTTLLDRYAELRRSHHAQRVEALRRRLRDAAVEEAAVVVAGGVRQHAGAAPGHARSDATASSGIGAAQLQAAWDRSDDEARRRRGRRASSAEALATAARGQAAADRRGAGAPRRARRLGRGAAATGPTPAPTRCSTGSTETCRTAGGGWNDERVIVFTEYRDTQKWLIDLLLTHGFGGDGGERIATCTAAWTPTTASGPRPSSRRTRRARRCGSCWRPTPRPRASTCSATAGGCCTGRSRGTHRGSSSATAGSTATASRTRSSRSATSSPRAGRTTSSAIRHRARVPVARRLQGRADPRRPRLGRVRCSPTRWARPCWAAARSIDDDAIDRARSKPGYEGAPGRAQAARGAGPMPRAARGSPSTSSA